MQEEWKEFITKNINSCTCIEHCDICYRLIELFDDKFKLMQETVGLKDLLKNKYHEFNK